MSDRETTQVIALAALFQSLLAVTAVARRGQADPLLVQTCLSGLLRPYQGDLEGLYGGIRRLHPGLQTLAEQLSQPKDAELTRYFITILHLESRLAKRQEKLQVLGSRLTHAKRQSEYFDSFTAPPIIQHLATLYSEQVSDLRPRVMVQGARPFLEQPQNAELIRALLLAAVRSASLWRQAGGRRWQILFSRRRIADCARALLARPT